MRAAFAGTNVPSPGYWFRRENHDDTALGDHHAAGVAGGGTARLHRPLGGERGCCARPVLYLRGDFPGPADSGFHAVTIGKQALGGARSQWNEPFTRLVRL